VSEELEPPSEPHLASKLVPIHLGNQSGLNIGFVSTRFKGVDGVTLESSKWAKILQSLGHTCYWFAGDLDRHPSKSYLTPQAFFNNSINTYINGQIFGQTDRSEETSRIIEYWAMFLQSHMTRFVDKYDIDLVIAENALTIPMHVPLGLALTDLLSETKLPAIAHHHDFHWERVRFAPNAIPDYLLKAFPPNLANLEHVVINSVAQKELKSRTGISSTIIPNVMDFANPPEHTPVDYELVRQDLGLHSDNILLQPTRMVDRKGCEHSMELLRLLNTMGYDGELVISHKGGDEGQTYEQWLELEAKEKGIHYHRPSQDLFDPLNPDPIEIQSGLSLPDLYKSANCVTLPSLHEGFGNALLEAIFFHTPLFVNRYRILDEDISPRGSKGLQAVEIDIANGKGIDKDVAVDVLDMIKSKQRRTSMTDNNYAWAAEKFPYAVAEKLLVPLVNRLTNSSQLYQK